MMVYKEWEGAGGWYCTDTSNFKNAKWWLPARMLNIPLTDFIMMLKNEYGANKFAYNQEKDVLVYSFPTYEKAHKFVLFINREARKRNFGV